MKNDIIVTDVSKEYIAHIDRLLERSKLEILEWFNQPALTFKVKTYIYKDKKSLHQGMERRTGKKYPSYMVACQVDKEQDTSRSINLYEPPIHSENDYTKTEYNQVVFHELIHYITDIIFGKLPEWITEGIAVYLDGSYKINITNLMKLINTYEIPDVSLMKEDNFVIVDYTGKTIYNGYDLSYIMVRYIIETLDKEYLFALMRNKDQIKLTEQTTLVEAIEYFSCQYLQENTIKKENL